ncbi:MAG TPA: hypothetical protein ENN23_07540 [Deltaproteobacteria bacterium]|nr:hypothetical protein [Deltaproteobacteria bacterium]
MFTIKIKLFLKGVLFVCVFIFIACGGLRFSQLDPAARDFHPQSIAVLKVETGPYEEAKESVEKIVAEMVAERKWFTRVVDAQELRKKALADKELEKALVDYLAKLNTLNYSDPYLSRKVGEIVNADAFLLVLVDVWGYAVENDKKVAKVNMRMRLYEAATGHLMWTAGHDRTQSYTLFKPQLSSVAQKVVRDMISHIPR